MGSILDIDTALELSNEELGLDIAKKNLFLYLYKFASYGVVYLDKYKDGYTYQVCALELDHESIMHLNSVDAFLLSESMSLYNTFQSKTRSRFLKNIMVNTLFVYIRKEIIEEYQNWNKNNSEEYKEIEFEKLKSRMIDFYNNNFKIKITSNE